MNKLIPEIMSEIILCMYEFQKLNNITKQCVTNVQFLFDVLKVNYLNVKVVPVIVLFDGLDLNQTCLVDGHLVLVFENQDTDKNIDPSYEITILENKHYFYKIKDFIKKINVNNNKYILKKIIDTFLAFQKLADKINNNEFLICDKKFYNEQANYIEKKLNIQFRTEKQK